MFSARSTVGGSFLCYVSPFLSTPPCLVLMGLLSFHCRGTLKWHSRPPISTTLTFTGVSLQPFCCFLFKSVQHFLTTPHPPSCSNTDIHLTTLTSPTTICMCLWDKLGEKWGSCIIEPCSSWHVAVRNLNESVIHFKMFFKCSLNRMRGKSGVVFILTFAGSGLRWGLMQGVQSDFRFCFFLL